MKHLFTPEGLDALAAVVRAEPLLAFDFDGTLAPIVEHPDDAAVGAAVAAPLAALAARLPVAIVTGRSIGDVTPRLGFAARWVIGNHGAEGLADIGGGADRNDGSAAAEASHAGALDDLRERLRADAAALAEAGVTVEDKGLSLALHYRQAADAQAAAARIEASLTPLDAQLERFGGKCVVNVVAAHAPDKGDAVVALVERAGAAAAVFAGDDVNDEAVFRRAPPHWLTVRVGPLEPTSAARFRLDDNAEVAQMLERMLALLGAPPPAADDAPEAPRAAG